MLDLRTYVDQPNEPSMTLEDSAVQDLVAVDQPLRVWQSAAPERSVRKSILVNERHLPSPSVEVPHDPTSCPWRLSSLWPRIALTLHPLLEFTSGRLLGEAKLIESLTEFRRRHASRSHFRSPDERPMLILRYGD